MTSIVIDSSYALACVMPDEQRPRSMADVLRQPLAAPSIWPIEVASATLNSLRRRRLDLDTARAICQHFGQMSIQFVAPASAEPLRHLEEALAHALTPYDALYIDLALALRCPLATQDTALAKAARQARIPVLD